MYNCYKICKICKKKITLSLSTKIQQDTTLFFDVTDSV